MSATHEIPQPQLDRLQEQLDELFNGGGGGGEDPRVDGLIREVRALAQTVNGQSSSITNLQQSVSQLTQTVSGQTSDISDLETSVSQLTQTVSGQSSDISDLETSVSQLTQTVSGQTSDISDLETSVSQLTQTVTLQGTAIGSVQSDVSQLNSDVSSHSASIGLLQTNVSQLTQTVNGQGTSITSLQNDVESLNLFKNSILQPVNRHINGSEFEAPFNTGTSATASGIDILKMGPFVFVHAFVYLNAGSIYNFRNKIVNLGYKPAINWQPVLNIVDVDVVKWGDIDISNGDLRFDYNFGPYSDAKYLMVASFVYPTLD